MKDPANQQAFNKLLDWLDPDHNQAAVKYEAIRLRLMRFFQFHDCPFSEDCADDVIQRVTNRLMAGLEVKAGDPFSYFRTVAKNVLLEYWKEHHRKYVSLEDMPSSAQPAINPDELEIQQTMERERERAVERLKKCLDALPAETRQLFLRYHQRDQIGHIERRAQLAKELGLEINALRSRITRIRERLEKGIRNCLWK